jgi:glyoxylase-like metal-dependent hydrolase (beta-lactamase superfamily II)
MTPSSRREFVKTMFGGVAGFSLSTMSARQGFAQGSSSITATRLTDTILHIQGAGANVLAVIGPEGVLMIDGGLAERSGELLKVMGEHSGGRPVQVLVNTHWHLENTGSNDVLGKAGARIIAHENTKLWMGAEIVVQWQRKTYKPRAKQAIPTESFYTTGKMTFGKEEIQYGHLGQAHTDGDIYVFLPGPNILVTGDVFTVGSYPILDWSTGGWIGGLSDACQKLVAMTNAQTRIIPGAGSVQTSADLKMQADMCATMRTRFVDMMRKGMSARDMYNAAPTKEFDARWGDPKQFIANAYPGLWNHVREIGGIV